MKVASPAMPPAEPLNWLGLALAYHRLKQPDEARRCLDKATAWMKQANADRPKEEVEAPPLTMTLSDWLEYQILRREAETALNGSGTETGEMIRAQVILLPQGGWRMPSHPAAAFPLPAPPLRLL